MSVLHLSSDDFEDEVLNCQKTVLVDFWANWCNPCRMLAPVIEELADEVGDDVKVCKLDVDSAGSIAADYGIKSIPTVIIFNNGKIVEKFVGIRSKADYLQALRK
ncbi:MAG: thioredoxin [Clostridiales bacterium]|nr:thioredoxin [Clostridiales bacterium]